jgi:hypothetical protein
MKTPSRMIEYYYQSDLIPSQDAPNCSISAVHNYLYKIKIKTSCKELKKYIIEVI